MTKKLLLAAAALGALAFAGGANAGNLTNTSVIGTESIYNTGTDKVAPYVVAKDFALPTGGLKTNNATSALNNTLFAFKNTTNPIAVAVNTDYVITLTLSGSAKFTDQSQTVVTLGGVATTTTPILSADGKTLTIYAKTPTTVTGTPKLDTIAVSGFNLHVTAQDSVSVAYKLQQVVGSQTLDLDSSNAAEIIQFKNALSVYTTGAKVEDVAELPDFDVFKNAGGVLYSDDFESSIASYFTDLNGTDVPTVDNVIIGYTAKVTGPQVEDLLTSFNGDAISAATDVTATSATFSVATGGGDEFSAVLTAQPGLAISAGTYSVNVKPVYATDWSGPTSIDKTLFTITLDGTNFYAPWFALNNAGANSTLRIANNGTAAIGPIVVSLKANNGTVAPTGTHTIPSIEPGKFVSVTGGVLKTAFGTDAANGDLQITVQSQSQDVSAKVRTTQSTGQIYENSLGNLPQ